MSIAEISEPIYSSMLTRSIAHHVRRGFDQATATLMARQDMARCFVNADAVQARECERDQSEYIEDMSLGGETYDPGKDAR